LTHEDSKINIDIANASKALAEATRRDGSSMKTIAVLTMVFLPATFFAALFSVPSLGWTEPDKFALYWACTIPVTISTFVVWAGLTQREWINDVLRRMGRQVRGSKSSEK
jgi:Mg2+ and Co2+ transporter CorA